MLKGKKGFGWVEIVIVTIAFIMVMFIIIKISGGFSSIQWPW